MIFKKVFLWQNPVSGGELITEASPPDDQTKSDLTREGIKSKYDPMQL